MRLARFTLLAILVLTLLAAPLAAEAQPLAVSIVLASSGQEDGPGWQAFRDALQGLGYVEGKPLSSTGAGPGATPAG